MGEKRYKYDLSKGTLVCAACAHGDLPWLYGVRGDPSFHNGSRGKPPESKNEVDIAFEQILVFRNTDNNYCLNRRILPGSIVKTGKRSKCQLATEML